MIDPYQLVAATPKLYVALKALVENVPCAERSIERTGEWLAAEDAIAEAEGRES